MPKGDDSFDINGLIEGDPERQRKRRKGHQELTLREYLKLVKQDPKIAQSAAARVLEVILDEGVEEIPEEERWQGVSHRYLLFRNFFGLERPISALVDFVSEGARGLSTGKKVVLLLGPPAAAKSDTVVRLKRALEAYEKRPVYAIKGCALREEPLHLVPKELRSQFEKELGVRIEGELCHQCRYRLEKDYRDSENGTVRWWDFPIETFRFSIAEGRGIGSFEPSDQKSQDITQLSGQENLAISAKEGPDHPFAYVYSGELARANRGLFEGREFLQNFEEILWAFNSVAEEKELKIQGTAFPHLSIDTLLIGHTNLTVYKRFASEKGNEALHRRMYVIFWPHALRVQDEVRIYQKLIGEQSDFKSLKRCHIAPGALEMAAMFAVLTRLVESNLGVSRVLKMKVYNGERVLSDLADKDKAPLDTLTLLEEGQKPQDIAKREGMFGVNPSDVLAALDTALVQRERENGCLTPLTVLEALREVFDHRMGYTPEEIQHFQELLTAEEGESVMSEYREWVLEVVSKAFLKAHKDFAEELFWKYIEEATFHLVQTGKFIRGQVAKVRRDPVTGKPKEPDLKFLRSIEQYIPVDEAGSDIYRREVLVLKGSIPDFGPDTYPPLIKAIERKILADSRTTLGLVIAQDRPKGEEEKGRAQDLYDALIAQGFCPICARETVGKAAEFLSA